MSSFNCATSPSKDQSFAFFYFEKKVIKYIIYIKGYLYKPTLLIPDDKHTGYELHYFGANNGCGGEVAHWLHALLSFARDSRVSHDQHQTGCLENQQTQTEIFDEVVIFHSHLI